MHPIITILSFSGIDIVKKKSMAAVLLDDPLRRRKIFQTGISISVQICSSDRQHMLKFAILEVTGRGWWVNHRRANIFKSFEEKKNRSICSTISCEVTKPAGSSD